jgi:hypothetical protein
MPKLIDLSGQRYGRLVVIKRVGTRLGHPEWLCKCDCGKDHVATTNALRRFVCQSCGCYRNEFLSLGHAAASVPRPKLVEITYPIPPNTEPILARRYQWRWERVEREAKLIERGKWEEPEPKKFVPLIHGLKGELILVKAIDLLALSKKKQKKSILPRPTPIPFVPSSVVCGASIADRVRVVSPEELARL